MKKTLAAAFAALLISSGAVLAQAAEGPWTMEEFIAMYPEVTPETYALIDANGDGLIDQDELDAAVEAEIVPPMEG